MQPIVGHSDFLPGMHPPQQEHAGSSPFARYKKAKTEGAPVSIGALTMTLSPRAYIALYAYAETHKEWRQDLESAVEIMCSD